MNDLGTQGTSEVISKISYLSLSPSSTGYKVIPKRPPLSTKGNLTTSETYKVCVPWVPFVLKCFVATESTTKPNSLTWYSDNTVMGLFWLYTASLTRSKIGTFSADMVLIRAVTIGSFLDLVVLGSYPIKLADLIVVRSEERR